MELFPPLPRGMRGRARELEALERTVARTHPARLALVGAGGSGKSMLAAALGHRVSRRFRGKIHWFRTGAWDFRTLVEMLALRLGTARDVAAVRAVLDDRFIVLDNHEDDRAMASFLDAFTKTRVTFVITARRCLLSGVLVYPVTAPLVTSGQSAFPRVADLTRRLRWNPLALDIADAIVRARSATVSSLARFLDDRGVSSVHVMDHEDDLPEVALLVAWAWTRLSPESKRMLGVLAHVEGDHVDVASLCTLARAKPRSLAPLVKWHLVQEAMPGRFTVHAVVRHAVKKRTKPRPEAVFRHYTAMLERHPERVATEQTHLFSAMDHAHRTSNLDAMLRIERLLGELQ